MDAMSHRLAGRYQVTLRANLEHGLAAPDGAATALGRQALKLGLDTAGLVQLHDQALVAVMFPDHPPGSGDGTIEKAGAFLRRALVPVLNAALAAPPAAAPAAVPLSRLAERAAAQRRLKREVARREALKASLKESQQRSRDVLEQSRLMQTQMRRMSHRILCVQEEERKRISRELHDEISQVLTSINVRLAALKLEAAANTGGLKRRIASTQRLVIRSVAAVHEFARQLRPAMLDDLGLVPTLLAYAKDVGNRTGLRISLKTSPAGRIETLSGFKRTVLYRIAQEALANVVRHAEASEVKVVVQADANAVVMEIADNGKSFDVARVLGARRYRRLGILGMRERAEMAGGTFAIESAPGKGTTVRVRLPLRNGTKA